MESSNCELKVLLSDIMKALSDEENTSAQDWIDLDIRIQKAVDTDFLERICVSDDVWTPNLSGLLVKGPGFKNVAEDVFRVVQKALQKFIWGFLGDATTVPLLLEPLFKPYHKKTDDIVYAVRLINRLKESTDISVLEMDLETAKLVIASLISKL